MRRLLCVLANMNAGGAETFLMKLFRAVDREKYRFDFCINSNEKQFYEDEIESLGGRIFRIPPKTRNPIAFKRQLSEIIRSNNYQYVLRITSNAMGFWDLKIAKKAGAVVTVARSSNSSDGGSLISRISHIVGRILFGSFVDVKIAPSDLAAKYTFGEKAYENGKVKILPNGLDLSKYRYDEAGRKAVRDELGIGEDAFVIGHVGRFSEQKNHALLIDIFNEIKRKREDSVLLMVGDGELRDSIQRKAIELGMDKSVVFAGVRRDIPQLLSAMDVFVFPSFYEGMPNAVIEAQATGLKCVISTAITGEAAVTDIVSFCDIADSPQTWAELALTETVPDRTKYNTELAEKGYGIGSVSEEFTEIIFER